MQGDISLKVFSSQFPCDRDRRFQVTSCIEKLAYSSANLYEVINEAYMAGYNQRTFDETKIQEIYSKSLTPPPVVGYVPVFKTGWTGEIYGVAREALDIFGMDPDLERLAEVMEVDSICP